MLNMTLSNYLKGMITNEEVIEELLRMAQDIAMDIVLKQCEQWADVEPEYIYEE